MKVQELLNENVETPKIDAATIVNMAKSFDYKRLSTIEEIASKVESAIRAGEVISTVFEEIKYELNLLVKYGFEHFISKPHFYGKGNEVPQELYWDIGHVYGLQELKFFGKKLTKVSEETKKLDAYKAMVKFNEEFSPLVQVLAWLKDHKVSAAAKKKEAAEAKKEESDTWRKKYVNHKDVKKVLNILTELTNEKRDEIFKNEHKFLMSIADDIQDYLKHNEYSRHHAVEHFMKNPMSYFMFTRMVNMNTGQLVKDWKDFVKKEAQEAADQIIDGFIYKNTGKIAYVIFTKNNMKSVKLENVRISQGKVECDLHFEFKDGSRFTAASSVVQASSKHGKWFYRYPTTFHNVVLPNGDKMISPSEQKMEEVFAVS